MFGRIDLKIELPPRCPKCDFDLLGFLANRFPACGERLDSEASRSVQPFGANEAFVHGVVKPCFVSVVAVLSAFQYVDSFDLFVMMAFGLLVYLAWNSVRVAERYKKWAARGSDIRQTKKFSFSNALFASPVFLIILSATIAIVLVVVVVWFIASAIPHF